MLLVNVSSDEVDYGDVVPRLASGTETIAEHETQGSFERRFIGLLKIGFLIKGQNFVDLRRNSGNDVIYNSDDIC